ncbi:MAG TPA: hypothetical protein VMU67_06245 [Steroidobacteraceae bacterium]|nr:hypothetical protein [Steroidobacteraceae bacterium]
MTGHWRIPLLIEEQAGLERPAESIRIGVPLPAQSLRVAGQAVVMDAAGELLPSQARALALWPDGSIKWLSVDALAPIAAGSRTQLFVEPESTARASRSPGGARAGASPLSIAERGGEFLVTTGAAEFVVAGARPRGAARARNGLVIARASVGGANLLAEAGVRLRLLGCSGREYFSEIERAYIEGAGAVRGAVVTEGVLKAESHASPLRFKNRLTFTAGSATVRIEVELWNPQAARHPGGLWDLQDRGTVLFEDLTLSAAPRGLATRLSWYAERPESMRTEAPVGWCLYQDSSGGENWDSENHLDARGRLAVTFRGYRVTWGEGDRATLIAEGDRASPCLAVQTECGCIAATTLDFWQNFPKALRWRGGELSIALFPAESRGPHALQGGERKRHTVLLEFSLTDHPREIPALQAPVAVALDPEWVERSGAMGRFVAARRDPNRGYLRYVSAILEGPHSFASKREIIDEYGWRNFGDLYADHEAVRHRGPRALVSHFNNQYDFILGALTHYLRTGDARWRRLAEDAARHTLDIDLYHTDQDKAAFNHGLFWHTDHYKPAATCTHRTYSRRNGRSPHYGGGPSNEHNYTSGLLLYHYVSGDPEAARAVEELAQWVIAMDDGSRSPLGLLDSTPTGLASKTVDLSYHKPGRGAGNSINALIDGFELTGERRYLEKAEELIHRCIHPRDDIDALGLAEPEERWSYLVFLQVLGRYLELKVAWNETDRTFQYARASLRHYARWMLAHEVPYKDVLDKVQLPTETWPAHDVRKSHVLHLAAEFAPRPERAALHERAAFFFNRGLEDLLSFETAYLTRPLVILCVFGHIHAYYQTHPEEGFEGTETAVAFGSPETFVPQRRRWRTVWPKGVGVLAKLLLRAAAERLDLLGRYSTPLRL